MTTKETTTHTAGPWVASEIGPENGSWLKWAISAHGPIAYGGDNGDGRENSRANARLIAAAPSMHEALMRLAVIHPDGPCWCDCTGAGRPINEHLCPPHVHTEECDEARAAIAKAEGVR
jgi:hypothetical protein